MPHDIKHHTRLHVIKHHTRLHDIKHHTRLHDIKHHTRLHDIKHHTQIHDIKHHTWIHDIKHHTRLLVESDDIGLLSLVVGYCIMGAFIFAEVEKYNELETKHQLKAKIKLSDTGPSYSISDPEGYK
jgi:hypothetical protein